MLQSRLMMSQSFCPLRNRITLVQAEIEELEAQTTEARNYLAELERQEADTARSRDLNSMNPFLSLPDELIRKILDCYADDYHEAVRRDADRTEPLRPDALGNRLKRLETLEKGENNLDLQTQIVLELPWWLTRPQSARDCGSWWPL